MRRLSCGQQLCWTKSPHYVLSPEKHRSGVTYIISSLKEHIYETQTVLALLSV